MLRRVSRSRRDKTASAQSIYPSRWMNPDRTSGNAVSTAARIKGVSAPAKAQAHTPHAPPRSSPIHGKNSSINGRACSSQRRSGHGTIQNIPQAIKNPVTARLIQASLPCAEYSRRHIPPPPNRTHPPAGGGIGQAPGGIPPWGRRISQRQKRENRPQTRRS